MFPSGVLHHFISQRAFTPKCLVFKTIFPGETLRKEWLGWMKDRMLELFLFCTLRNGCLFVVRGNAAQRHRDGHHPSILGTEKGTYL